MLIKQPFEMVTSPVAFAAPAMASVSSATIIARGLVTETTALATTGQTISVSGTASSVDIDLVGGTDGERYLVTVRGLDTAGDAREAEIELAVVDLAWSAPDGSTPYLTIAQFVDRITLDEAIRLTEAVVPGKMDKARIIAAITDAQSVVDGYLATKYSVPLSPAPALITSLVYDLTVAKLWRGAPPEDVATARAAATQTLRDLAKGVMALPDSAVLTPTATSPTPILMETSERLFNRSRMAEF